MPTGSISGGTGVTTVTGTVTVDGSGVTQPVSNAIEQTQNATMIADLNELTWRTILIEERTMFQ